MRSGIYILFGTFFGIIMAKSEALSWYRIHEMFYFQSFHMYGIIGSAVAIGGLGLYWMRGSELRSFEGEPIAIQKKNGGWKRYLYGGLIFGLGWALTGACPGPMVVSLGFGYSVFIVVILSALAGTYAYSALAGRLPR